MPKQKTFIISLGGSLIAPTEGIDWKFLKKFRALILKQLKSGKNFYLVAGGGATCREYNEAASKIKKIKPSDLDWLGIHASRLNAHLVKTIFSEQSHQEIIKNPTIHMHTDKKIMVGGGWKPGWSTDYVATMIAQEYEVDTVINLSNIDYAYDKDPKKHPNARPIKSISWQDFRKIVGNVWTPGLNRPFDPIASKKAEQLNLKVIIAGRDLNNLKNILEGKIFKGTIIS